MAMVPQEQRGALDTAPFRFFSKIELNPSSGCWEWTGARIRGGYGKFFLRKEARPDGERKTILTPAHRWSYEFHRGQIPAGLEIDHLCRNRGCVNPEHLEAVTHLENCRRTPRAEACPKGHEFTEQNTRHSADRDGYLIRYCRQCRLEFFRVYNRTSRKKPA